MTSRRILTPTLLDRPVPGLDQVAGRGGWTLNAPPLPDTDPMTRTGVVLPPDRPVYVHVDVDVVDGAELPQTLYPEPGGPSKADVSRALAHLRDTRDVVAVSMTSWSPDQDADGTAADYCLGLLDTLTAPRAA